MGGAIEYAPAVSKPLGGVAQRASLRNRRLALFEHGIWVYAHRGTGFWGPAMRLGPTPEIAEITLTHNPEVAPGL